MKVIVKYDPFLDSPNYKPKGYFDMIDTETHEVKPLDSKGNEININ